MGLIKAALGAAGGALADSWKEFFYCDAMDTNTLVTKGKKKTSSRSSNTKGEDNIISNGAGIAVADGQFMIIVEQGKVVEACGEAGEFAWDSSTEPSVFTGKLGESILDTFKQIGKRFTYGGDTGKDQRIYYINTKEIIDNKFGTSSPIPFRVVDKRIGLDIDVSLRCNGVYSYKITNPLLFYTNVCGNVAYEYSRSEIDTTLKEEFKSALQPAMAKLSAMEIRPNEMIAHNDAVEKAMAEALSEEWGRLGISVATVALGSVTLPEADQQLIKDAQKAAMYRDPTMAAATLVGAQVDAMKAAAANDGGAMTGFMGMGMAMNQGGVNAGQLFAMGQQQQQAPAAPANGWTCACGAANTGKFCSECGQPKPADNGWVCACGAVNKGKFCSECGAKKPSGTPQYKCDKCGWEPKFSEPEDPTKAPKFCPECGDPFDAGDMK